MKRIIPVLIGLKALLTACTQPETSKLRGQPKGKGNNAVIRAD